MAIRIQQYATPPRRVQVGGIDPGFQQALVRNVGQDAAASTAQAMLDAGKQLTEIGIKEYVSQETARVSQALQDYKTQLSTEQERFTKENQGQNALGAGEHFDSFARDTAAPLAEKFSGKFRTMFMQDAAAFGLRFTEQGQSYASQQEKMWKKSAWDGDVAQAMDAIAQDPGNREFIETSLASLKGRYADLFPGMDNRAIDAEINHKASGIIIDSFLAKEDVGRAREAFTQYKDILGATAPQYEARINSLGRELQARARAERAERQFDVHARLQDSIAAWRQGQDAPTAPTQKEVVSAYGAEKGTRIWQEVESARAFGADIQAMSTLTPEEQIKMLADRKPQPGDGYASSLADYTRLEHAVKVDQELRQKDPIGYLLGKDRGVQTAFKSWQESPTPENAQTYAAKIQAAGAARGMRQSEVESPPLLPDSAAKDLAWRVANSDKPAEILEQQQSAWGQHWPSVERQLVTEGKMPTGLRVVASGMDKESGGLLASTYRNPKYKEQAKDVLGLTESSFKDLRERVHGELEQFTATLQAQGDLEMAATITDSATRLTLEYMQRGFDVKDAARKASEDVALNRYRLVEQGDGYYRVPSKVDADAIAKGARSALLDIASKPESITVPKASGGLTSQFIAQSASSVIKRDGEWVTAPDESGLNLYVQGRPVRDTQGKIIFRSWADLVRIGSEDKQYQRPTIEDIMNEYDIGGHK
ncbi:hypothetical protein [Desulfovibrio intestinalis]|uniref:Uncharacterized protein n=1 Tax=Desulfovibrio intestinalis TaxID=58621 RepID=A0A7W8FHK3_9BACT|nr:hypothetical protein [Desulfovibrio intestinalis]MBB5143957.1 hypothetical protein [Desulfovibrio intestinalis]